MPAPRVLVADDHDEMRARIASLLESEFHVVATVADGLEVLWNQFISPGKCSLIRGYSSEQFGRGAGFEAISHEHTQLAGEGRA
jgi:DNA-binding NtrC family response regulator